MTINTDALKGFADKLPKGYKENALALIGRMGEVVEGIGDEPIVWRPGNLRIRQSTTDRSTVPKGSEVGDLILGETKLDRPLKFIPLLIWNARQMWSPDQNDSKMLCSSPDAKLGRVNGYCNQCPHKVWDESNNRSDCGSVKQAICILEDLSDIFVVSFAKTNYRVGMDFEALLKKAGVAPYRRVYQIDTQTNSKAKNVENYKVSPAEDKATKADLLEFLGELFKQVQGDRKESVDKFYEITLERLKNKPAVLLESSGADTTLVIEHDGGEAEVVVSDMAKNYVV